MEQSTVKDQPSTVPERAGPKAGEADPELPPRASRSGHLGDENGPRSVPAFQGPLRPLQVQPLRAI